jgi:hypothetical protein
MNFVFSLPRHMAAVSRYRYPPRRKGTTEETRLAPRFADPRCCDPPLPLGILAYWSLI